MGDLNFNKNTFLASWHSVDLSLSLSLLIIFLLTDAHFFHSIRFLFVFHSICFFAVLFLVLMHREVTILGSAPQKIFSCVKQPYRTYFILSILFFYLPIFHIFFLLKKCLVHIFTSLGCFQHLTSSLNKVFVEFCFLQCCYVFGGFLLRGLDYQVIRQFYFIPP